MSYFIVYSCVASSPARVPKTGYFPVSHVSTDDLRVTCQDIKWNFCLGSIEFGYEVEESFAYADSLIVR